MKPSKKSPEINKLIDSIIGVNREQRINSNKCIPPPIGCGKPIGEFRDELSRKEYTISGLCSECQDKIFGS